MIREQRSTKGQRMNELVGKAMEEDDMFYNNDIWNEKRYDIMKKALILKFGQNEDIKKILLETNNKILYESSKFDKIWGIGYFPSQVINADKNKFGKNLLGLCLMEVRNLLKNI